jgi:hypothetical protein
LMQHYKKVADANGMGWESLLPPKLQFQKTQCKLDLINFFHQNGAEVRDDAP